MRRRVSILISLLLVCGSFPMAESEWGLLAEPPGYEWSFPRDHWAHRDYRIEWWYLTGHLSDREDPSRRFGYQFTFFRIGLSRENPGLDSDWAASTLIMGHAAITDKRDGKHRFSEVLHRESPLLGGFSESPEPLIAWSRGPAGTERRWTLRWNGAGFDIGMEDRAQQMALSLVTRPLKPRILQGPGGFSRKSEAAEAASLYYSYTRLATEGRLELDGAKYEVTGQSWMDKEFSTSQLDQGQVGWDWFSLQLDDGRELMLYELRAENGATDHGRGTLVDLEGGVTFLELCEWTTSEKKKWQSSESGITYPAGWRVELPQAGIAVEVLPDVADQENRSRVPAGPTYWEGAVTVRDLSGTVV